MGGGQSNLQVPTSVGSVHFDPNNTTFVTSSMCDIKVWDAAKGNVLLHFAYAVLLIKK